MRVRLVDHHDEDEIVDLARSYADEAAEVLPHIEFDEQTVRNTVFRSLTSADPTIFVAEADDGLVGMMVASIQGFYFMSGVFVQSDIFYVRPEYRGTRAAALLLVELNTWADQLGAKVTIGGNANKLNSDRTARLYERFGYQQAGFNLLRPKGA